MERITISIYGRHFTALEISVLWPRGLSSATDNGLRSATTVVMPSNNDITKEKKHKSRGGRHEAFFKRALVSLRYRESAERLAEFNGTYH